MTPFRIWLVEHALWSLFRQNVEFPRAFEARSPRRGLGSRMQKQAKTHLDGITHEQTFICRSRGGLSANEKGGGGEIHRMIISVKPWPNYRTKLDSTFQLLLDPTLFDRLAAHVGWCSSNIFCSIKCWIEFDFDQALCPTILLDEKMLQCFDALPTKLYLEASHVGHAGQSRIAILFSGLGFSRNLQQRWLLMNSQRARKEKKKKKKKRDEREASLEGFESRNFEQMSGSIAFTILRTTPGWFSSFP